VPTCQNTGIHLSVLIASTEPAERRSHAKVILPSHNGIIRRAALAGVLSLVGCVSAQQQQAAVVVPATAAPSRPIAAAVRPPPVIEKSAASGAPIILDQSVSVDPDCRPLGVPTVRISQPPVHGTVTPLHQDVYPNFPPDDSRYACNNTKIPGIVIQYASTAGFVGSDFTGTNFTFPDGKEFELKFAITVK
jgi:hypothetical protein